MSGNPEIDVDDILLAGSNSSGGCWIHAGGHWLQVASHRGSMGTVPDPEATAKGTSGVESIKEEDCPADLQSPNHPHNPALTGKNGNGVPIPEPKVTTSCSFDIKCKTAIDISKSEQLCELSKHSPSQTATGSPSSPANQAIPADAAPPIGSEPPRHCVLSEDALAGENNMKQAMGIPPSNHTAMPSLPSSMPLPSSSPQADSSIVDTCRTTNSASVANGHQPIVSSIKDQEQQDCCTQLNAVSAEQNEKQVVVSNLTLGPLESASIAIGRERNQRPTALPLTSNCNVDLESTASNKTETPASNISVPTQCQDTPQQSSVYDIQQTQNAVHLKREDESSNSCKYKDMGTMTNERHSCSSHDAEVQAVAHVESKSVSTSPSILAAYVRENPFQFKDSQDQVYMIYRGGPRPGMPEHGKAFPMRGEMPRNPLITPKVRFRATAMEVLNPAYLRLHGKQGMPTEGPGKIPPNLAKVAYQRPEASAHPMMMYKGEPEAQAVGGAREGSGLTQPPLAAPVLLNVKPAYQINIDSSNQNKPSQRPLEIRAQSPNFMAAQDINKRPGHHLLSVADSNQMRVNRPTDYDADASGERKPFHFKITNELGTTQAIITTDIMKPKKEEKPAFLNFEGDIASNIGAAGGQVEEFLQVFIKKEQDKLQDETEQAKRSSSLSIQSRAASDSIPLTPRLKKAREEKEKKEQKLAAAAATADQSKLPLGKKLNQAGSKTEDKGKASTKSVKDVVWDEQGMTWEVYGAAMDPESLGIAIQNHLTRQIREHEKLIRAQLKQNRKSISSDTSSRKKMKGRQNNVIQSLLQNFRRPNCCAHPPPSSVID